MKYLASVKPKTQAYRIYRIFRLDNRKSFFLESGAALTQAAQGGGITVPRGDQAKGQSGTEGCG